ncbi:cellulose-binding protein [Colletotrichum acutatum]
MSVAEARKLRSRSRLYAISDQDNTGPWMRAQYPDMFYIVSVHAFNEYAAATWPGMNVADCACVPNETVLNPWLDANIRLGPLGSAYPQIEFEFTKLFVNTIDSVVGMDGNTWTTHQASIWRWRAAYQDDRAARMQWTLIQNFIEATHPPILNVNGHQGPDPLFVTVKANHTYIFSANLTYDPDHPTDNSLPSFL